MKLARQTGPAAAKLTIVIIDKNKKDPKKPLNVASLMIYLAYFEGHWTTEGSWDAIVTGRGIQLNFQLLLAIDKITEE